MSINSTPPLGGSGPTGHSPLEGPSGPPGKFDPSSGGGWGAYEKWMGEKNFKMFQKNICEAISKQIGKDKEKSHEASERLKKSATGEDSDDT